MWCGTIRGCSTIEIMSRNKDKTLQIVPQCGTIRGCSTNRVNMVVYISLWTDLGRIVTTTEEFLWTLITTTRCLLVRLISTYVPRAIMELLYYTCVWQLKWASIVAENIYIKVSWNLKNQKNSICDQIWKNLASIYIISNLRFYQKWIAASIFHCSKITSLVLESGHWLVMALLHWYSDSWVSHKGLANVLYLYCEHK